MLNLRRFFVIQVIIILLSFSPLLITFGAGAIANYYGCELHEGFVNPCMAFGRDIGEDLYTSFVLGWFTLITLPFGFAVWLLHLGYGIFRFIKSRKQAS